MIPVSNQNANVLSHRTPIHHHQTHWRLMGLLLLAFATFKSEAIHPISSYTKMIKQLNEEVFGNITSATGVFLSSSSSSSPKKKKNRKQNRQNHRLQQQAMGNLQEPRSQQPDAGLSSSSSSPITTTMYINYYQDELYPISDKTTSIFTSLGGEDDDNNNNNNSPNHDQVSMSFSKTIAWIVLGAICTIPFTEFILDPMVLMWAMAFFGWLSYEEYDYPTTPTTTSFDNSDVHYPGCTDRRYFMTDEEVETETEPSRYQPQQQQPLPFDARYPSTPPRGGNMNPPRSANKPQYHHPRLRRRGITFFGIQAGMIVLGDWLVRCMLPKTSMDGVMLALPSWLEVLAFPLQVMAVICSMVVQFRVQQHQVELSVLVEALNLERAARQPESQQQLQQPSQQQNPIPYWLGYYMDHIAILLPIALLAFEFLFDSNILWNGLTRVLSRHVGLDGHGSFQPFLVNRVLMDQ